MASALVCSAAAKKANKTIKLNSNEVFCDGEEILFAQVERRIKIEVRMNARTERKKKIIEKFGWNVGNFSAENQYALTNLSNENFNTKLYFKMFHRLKQFWSWKLTSIDKMDSDSEVRDVLNYFESCWFGHPFPRLHSSCYDPLNIRILNEYFEPKFITLIEQSKSNKTTNNLRSLI